MILDRYGYPMQPSKFLCLLVFNSFLSFLVSLFSHLQCLSVILLGDITESAADCVSPLCEDRDYLDAGDLSLDLQLPKHCDVLGLEDLAFLLRCHLGELELLGIT